MIRVVNSKFYKANQQVRASRGHSSLSANQADWLVRLGYAGKSPNTWQDADKIIRRLLAERRRK